MWRHPLFPYTVPFLSALEVLLLRYRKFYANGANVDTFFTATSARTAYKNHIKTVVNRKNSINGVVSPEPMMPC